MRRSLLIFLALVAAVPLGAARQPLRARHGMVVAMEATAADVGVAATERIVTAARPRASARSTAAAAITWTVRDGAGPRRDPALALRSVDTPPV